MFSAVFTRHVIFLHSQGRSGTLQNGLLPERGKTSGSHGSTPSILIAPSRPPVSPKCNRLQHLPCSEFCVFTFKQDRLQIDGVATSHLPIILLLHPFLFPILDKTSSLWENIFSMSPSYSSHLLNIRELLPASLKHKWRENAHDSGKEAMTRQQELKKPAVSGTGCRSRLNLKTRPPFWGHDG